MDKTSGSLRQGQIVGGDRPMRFGSRNCRNLASRREVSARSQFDKDIVDGFLLWANGIDGKIIKLIFPPCFNNYGNNHDYKSLLTAAQTINSK
jgi:hypothetical protein